MKSLLLLVVGLLTTAGESVAQEAACKVNFKQEGGFIAGRRFSTWDVVPGVSIAEAYKRIHLEGVKSGLNVIHGDKEMGTITFEQSNAGVTNTGAQVDLPWNVTLEDSAESVRVSVSKTTPGGYATSQEFQIESMCAVIDAARL